MKTMLGAAGIALAIAMATPAAAASLVQYQYQGSVADVFGPDSAGVSAGDEVDVRLRFDPSFLFDVTAAANAAYGTSYGSIKAATLNVPGAFLHVTVGSDPVTGVFSGADQFDVFGDPFGTGGNPYVLFKDGGFFGVSFFGVNPTQSAFATAGAAPELYDFVGGSFKIPGPSYGGFFDYSSAVRTDGVPEPAAWSLMIAGFGMAGAVLRRRRTGRISHRRAVAVATTAVLTAAASPALAGPPAPVPTAAVAYADLALASPADAAVMLERIRHAAVAACQQGRMMIGTDIEAVERFEACRRDATSRAVARLNAPLVTMAFEGRPVAAFRRAALTR